MIMRFFFTCGWFLTIAVCHVTDKRLWKAIAPFLVVAIVAFVAGKLL